MVRILTAMIMGLIVASPASAAESYTFDEVVYLSCQEAWTKSGESTENAIAMIRVLAEFSLESRGLSVPEGNEDLSGQFGELIKAHCIVDPDGLLFNAVDKSVRTLL